MEYNASNTRAIRKAQKAAKQAAEERGQVIFNLMSSPAGRCYIYERLIRCHIFGSSFSSSALGMAFNEGERNIGLQDLNDVMSSAPDQYIQMMREANDRNQNDGRRTDNDSESGRRGEDGGGGDSGSILSDYTPDPRDDDLGEV